MARWHCYLLLLCLSDASWSYMSKSMQRWSSILTCLHFCVFSALHLKIVSILILVCITKTQSAAARHHSNHITVGTLSRQSCCRLECLEGWDKTLLGLYSHELHEGIVRDPQRSRRLLTPKWTSAMGTCALWLWKCSMFCCDSVINSATVLFKEAWACVLCSIEMFIFPQRKWTPLWWPKHARLLLHAPAELHKLYSDSLCHDVSNPVVSPWIEKLC